jgi:hypothetical protein
VLALDVVVDRGHVQFDREVADRIGLVVSTLEALENERARSCSFRGERFSRPPVMPTTGT